MGGVILFLALIYVCCWLDTRDFLKIEDNIYDPYILERGYMLEEDAERLYRRNIRRSNI